MVHHKAGQFGGLKTDHRHYQVWLKLKATNLDPAYPLVSWRYAGAWGRPARCLVSMFRSCLAMLLCGQSSFDNWVQLMRDEPFYALISGFAPDDVPGVGTFYDFQDRLLQRTRQPRTRKQRPHYQREQQDKGNDQRDKNNLRPHQNIINPLADRILARPQSSPPLAATSEGFGDVSALPPWEQSLQTIFFSCFVARSADLKLIDLDQLHLVGDGTKLPTWAKPYGKKLCQGDNHGKKAQERCRCYRAYRDPLARWGWV